MPRRNAIIHGRRRGAKAPVPVVAEPEVLSCEGMARELVRRGLATEAILDGALRPADRKPRPALSDDNERQNP